MKQELGHAGLNAIGRGLLLVEDSTHHGRSLVSLRSDYGSIWDGQIVIRNCRRIPAAGGTATPHMIGMHNDGTHDFGYECFMPREVVIDGLQVDDSRYPAGYQGMFLFGDPGGGGRDGSPLPYAMSRKVTIRGLTTASGKTPRISPNERLREKLVVVWEDDPPSRGSR